MTLDLLGAIPCSTASVFSDSETLMIPVHRPSARRNWSPRQRWGRIGRSNPLIVMKTGRRSARAALTQPTPSG